MTDQTEKETVAVRSERVKVSTKSVNAQKEANTQQQTRTHPNCQL